MGEWEKAREKVLFAILLDPDFEEAFKFLAGISFEKQAKRFNEFASTSDNSGVVFNRMGFKKKKVYYHPTMKTFGEAMIKHLNFEKYNPVTDIQKPCFFEGLYYPECYETFKNHKGEKAVYWNGGDLRRLEIHPEYQKILHENPARHITFTEQYHDRLLKLGIWAEVKPMFFGNIDEYPVCFKPGNEVYTTAHTGDVTYDTDWAIKMCKKYGLKLHIYGLEGKSTKNVIYHGHIPEAQMNQEVKNFQGALKITSTGRGGMSQTCIKSLFMGQYPVDKLDPEAEQKLKAIKDKTEPNPESEKYRNNYFNQFEWMKQ